MTDEALLDAWRRRCVAVLDPGIRRAYLLVELAALPVSRAASDPTTTSYVSRRKRPSPASPARRAASSQRRPTSGSNFSKNSGVVANTGCPWYESPICVGIAHSNGAESRSRSNSAHPIARGGISL